MIRFIALLLLLLVGAQFAEPAFAARRAVVRHRHHRTTVIVHRGWPLRRPARVVVVRPARVVVRVTPGVYLAPMLFAGAVIAATSAPAHDVLAWEDGETISRAEDWTEFTLNCDTRGTRLWYEVVEGKVQADWAEIVFENGDTQVVDFAEKTHGTGLYPLLDFKDGRKVDHVRMVARAKTEAARIVLRMEK